LRNVFLILAAAVLAFGGALWAPFHLDDFALLQDTIVTSADGWWRAFGLMQTRPLTWFSFWVNHRLGGAQPWGYHLVNLLLHLVSIVLLRQALARLLPPTAAVIATALFALHPIQTETVVYVFDRATLLMTLFCLISLLEWTRERPWQAVAWFLPALLAKEECVAFPLFLWLLNRGRKAQIGAMLLMSLAAGARVLYVSTLTAGSGAGAQAGIGPFDYFLTQGLALLRYLRLLVLPYGFSLESPLNSPGFETGVIAWIAVAALVALAWRWVDRRWPLAWFILIAPSSTLLPAADLSADRRMYLPIIAIASLGGLLLHHRPRWIAISIVATLSLVSVRQTVVWQSGERLWREAMQFAPRKVRPRIQLARQLPPQQALAVLAKAEKLAPDDPGVPAEKGRVLLDLNHPQAALGEFGRALALAPGDARAVNNRGVALLRLNQKEAAIADFNRALSMDHCLFDARRNLYAAGVTPLPPPSDCRYTPEQRDSLPR
jgi:hypothetical protein